MSELNYLGYWRTLSIEYPEGPSVVLQFRFPLLSTEGPLQNTTTINLKFKHFKWLNIIWLYLMTKGFWWVFWYFQTLILWNEKQPFSKSLWVISNFFHTLIEVHSHSLKEQKTIALESFFAVNEAIFYTVFCIEKFIVQFSGKRMTPTLADPSWIYISINY